MIAVGFGTGQNRAWGGGGDDILIANQGDDWLYGEDGNDVFTGLGHGAHLSGGDGLDVATYHNSINGILVDSGSVETLFGTDHFDGVEAIIGSNQSDIFQGNTDMLYFGAGGDDEFHLQDGDVASGGSGADKFIIDTTRGGNVAILDFRLGDQLIIDGTVYTGIRLSGGWYNETLPDGSERTVQVLEKTSSFDHVVQNRQIWHRSADSGSVEFTQDSEFSLYGDLDPGKSDSFVWQGDKGLLTFDNNGTKTNVILMNPSGPGFGMTFDWLSHTQFAMWGDRFTDVQPIIQHHDGYYPGLLDQHMLIPQVLSQFDLLF